MEYNRIHALPPEVIGQIAAGEVVERPAAAIKELVENSIDAKATAITVDIREGGLTSFRVTDNGKGIMPQDIRMAFARHATSKIRTATDLFGVQSLGFRGEALASIAAVAKVTCITRAKEQDIGVQAVNEGGQFTEIRDAACPEGTSFTVKDLFFNAPVRRKFLKKPSVETAHVSELMERLILSRPDISFRFIVDGKTVYFSSGDGKLENACMSIFGLNTLKMMIPVHGCEGGVQLDGLVGIGEAARGNRSKEYFFLNQRAMKSTLLSAAIEDACRQLVTIGRFPICALHLTMPYENVDVNVHPNKWEVRFANEIQLKQSVLNIVSDALLHDRHENQRIPSMFATPEVLNKPATVTVTQNPTEKQPAVSVPPVSDYKPVANATEEKAVPEIAPAVIRRSTPLSFHEAPVQKQPAPSMGFVPPPRHVSIPQRNTSVLREIPTSPQQSPVSFSESVLKPNEIERKQPPVQPSVPEIKEPEQIEHEHVALQFRQKPIHMLGVAFDTYIILQYEDRLLMCDQHAIHERLLYEKLMRETANSSASQTFLLPLIVQLNRTEYNAFAENKDALLDAGFDCEDFGGMTVQLRGVPIILGQPQAERCFLDALDELCESGTISQQNKVQRIIQMACKHAVKGGEKLPHDALIDLVRRMLTEDIRLTCPHGRPLMIELTRTDLEKRFKRIQN